MAPRRSATKTKRGRRLRPSPRERLLASATRLFISEGIRVIGIDRILKEADVAKASLYSLYGSKDALVLAYVRELDRAWRAEWEQRTHVLDDPEDKVLAFFDQCADELQRDNYRGSHFQNAASEYPRPETESEQAIIDAVLEHRRWCHRTIADELTKRNGYPSGTQANEILVFLDGGVAGSRLTRSLEPLTTARMLAQQMLEAPPADYSI